MDESPVASAVVRADAKTEEAVPMAAGVGTDPREERPTDIPPETRATPLRRTGDTSPAPGVPAVIIFGTPCSSRPMGGCPHVNVRTLAIDYA